MTAAVSPKKLSARKISQPASLLKESRPSKPPLEEQQRRFRLRIGPPQALAPVPEDGLVDFLVYRPRPGGRRFRVLRTDRGFRIAGVAPTDEEELAAALKAAGARKGDEVEVDGELLELQ